MSSTNFTWSILEYLVSYFHFNVSHWIIDFLSFELIRAVPATLLKKRLWHWCFPVNFAKFLRTAFFYIEHLWWLLLSSKWLGGRNLYYFRRSLSHYVWYTLSQLAQISYYKIGQVSKYSIIYKKNFSHHSVWRRMFSYYKVTQFPFQGDAIITKCHLTSICI